MKAAQLQKKGEKYTIVDVPKPKVGRGHLLIKIQAAGFCHTDIMVASGDFGSPFPLIGSHEPAGLIVEIGEGVTDFAVGDRVTSLNHAETCGKCQDCREGGDNLYVSLECHTERGSVFSVCPNGKFSGLHVDGNFAEYFVALASRSAKIPEGMSFETAAPLSCAGVTIYGAIKKANLPPGSVLAISGLGALGHIGVQMAKALGYFTVGVDARPGPIDLCNSFDLAPDLCIDASKVKVEDAIKEIKQATDKSGLRDRPDGVDVTAESKAAISYALSLTKQHGTFVLVSQPETITIPFREIVFRDVRIVGSLQGGQRYLQEAVNLVQNKGIVVKTESWQLDDINKMWEKQESGGMVGKNVVAF